MPAPRSRTLLGQVAVLILLPFLAASAAPSRGYIGGGVINLSLAGAGNAYVKSVQGGNPVQQPTVRGTRADRYPDKIPGALHFEDAHFEFPLSLPQALWDWINASSEAREAAKKRLVLSEFDYTNKETSHLIFEDCSIRTVELPACDSASRTPGYLKLSVAPTRVIDAAVNPTAKPTTDAKLKPWKSSGFRLSVDGIDASSVIKIEPMVIKRSARSQVEISNLVVTIADVDLDDWKQWAIQGFEGKPAEKNGKLQYLAEDGTTTILAVALEGLGVVRLVREKYEPSVDPTRRTKVELYVEKIVFSVPAA